jgi:hypothetical protein
MKFNQLISALFLITNETNAQEFKLGKSPWQNWRKSHSLKILLQLRRFCLKGMFDLNTVKIRF